MIKPQDFLNVGRALFLTGVGTAPARGWRSTTVILALLLLPWVSAQLPVRTTYHVIAPCALECIDELAKTLRGLGTANTLDDRNVSLAIELDTFPGVSVVYRLFEGSRGSRVAVRTTINSEAQGWLAGVEASDMIDMIHELESTRFMPMLEAIAQNRLQAVDATNGSTTDSTIAQAKAAERSEGAGQAGEGGSEDGALPPINEAQPELPDSPEHAADPTREPTTEPRVRVRARMGTIPFRDRIPQGWHGGPYPVLVGGLSEQESVESGTVPFFAESAACRILDGGTVVTAQPIEFNLSHRAARASLAVVATDSSLRINYQSEASTLAGSRPFVMMQSVRYANHGRGLTAFVLDVPEGSEGPLFLNVEFRFIGDGPASGTTEPASGYRETRFVTWTGCGEESESGPGNHYLDSNYHHENGASQPGVYQWPLPTGTTQIVFSVFNITSSRERALVPSTLSSSVVVWLSNE